MRLLAGNGAEIIYKTGREYQTAEFSAIAAGKNTSSSQHALTRREFRSRLFDDNSKAGDGFTSDVHLKLSPFGGVYDSPFAAKNEFTPAQLIYLYDKIIDPVSFTAGAGINDSFYAKLIYTASCSKKTIADGSGILQPVSAEYYDSGDSPKEGYVSFAADHFSAALGRFKSGSGNGIMGNLFQNSLASYYDQFSFSFYNRFVKYYYMMGMSSYYLTKEEKKYLDEGDSSATPPIPRAVDYTYEPVKMFAFHRIELAPVDTLTIGIGEMTLVGGKLPDFNMVNPLGVYHNIYESTYHSYYAGIDISWVPAKRHFIFAELLANEIYVKGESNTDPTATGAQIGYWYILPLDTQTKHRAALELTHVDGWTYSDLTPYLTMYQRQIQREITFDIPLGYSYGGDLEQLSLIYTAVSIDGIKLNVTLSRLHKGEIGLELIHPGAANAQMPYASRNKYKGRPTGVVEKWSTAELSMELPLTERISVNVLGHYAYIQNFGHIKGETDQLVFFSAGLSLLVF
jgi:hypothetical protein